MSDKPEKASETYRLSLGELIDLPPQERIQAEIRILEGLMAGAIRNKKFSEASQIFSRVQSLLRGKV